MAAEAARKIHDGDDVLRDYDDDPDLIGIVGIQDDGREAKYHFDLDFQRIKPIPDRAVQSQQAGEQGDTRDADRDTVILHTNERVVVQTTDDGQRSVRMTGTGGAIIRANQRTEYRTSLFSQEIRRVARSALEAEGCPVVVHRQADSTITLLATIAGRNFVLATDHLTARVVAGVETSLRLRPIANQWACQPMSATPEASYILRRYRVTIDQRSGLRACYEPFAAPVHARWAGHLLHGIGVRMRDGGARFPLVRGDPASRQRCGPPRARLAWRPSQSSSTQHQRPACAPGARRAGTIDASRPHPRDAPDSHGRHSRRLIPAAPAGPPRWATRGHATGAMSTTFSAFAQKTKCVPAAREEGKAVRRRDEASRASKVTPAIPAMMTTNTTTSKASTFTASLAHSLAKLLVQLLAPRSLRDHYTMSTHGDSGEQKPVRNAC
ncbi:hypothetical protein BDZ90DRAFT_71466 [Jaminaea rosea]|uniref:Uncharacterized protein n=1 Tax=Jaminaea rosea TaxID=1569628 RepID=A0A316ULK9_9BASI|nr:hypothetical protein BDZ90DRAFT_71466 [Jaminaea rosea]PWN25688.1 hypothetical protein BDZ90DRAFT_71466 [Jaminaea rosea]